MTKDIRILLVNPGFKQIYGFTKEGSSILPSLGLLSIAGALRDLEGTTVEYFDFEIDDESLVEEKLIKDKYDLVGITGTTPYFPGMLKIAEKVKQIAPDTFVIAGGPHATACFEDILHYEVFDAVATGESEISMEKLVTHLKNGKKFKEVKGSIDGVIFNGTYPKNIRPAFIPDLNSLPIPAYDLVDWGRYYSSFHRDNGELFASIITSRGCPFKCSYCKTPFDPSYRYKNSSGVLREVEYLVKNIGVKTLQFWDDTFTLNKKRAIKISKGMSNFGINWNINTRPDCVDEEVLNQLKEGGCTTIFYGVESSNEEILRKLRRNISISRIKRVFILTKKIGIKTVAGCIIGLPYDTGEQVLKTVEFVKSLEPDFVHFSIYSPNPGTFLFNEVKSSGLLSMQLDWNKATKYKGAPLGMPTSNPNMDRERLQELLRYAYSQFILPNNRNYDKTIIRRISNNYSAYSTICEHILSRKMTSFNRV